MIVTFIIVVSYSRADAGVHVSSQSIQGFVKDSDAADAEALRIKTSLVSQLYGQCGTKEVAVTWVSSSAIGVLHE